MVVTVARRASQVGDFCELDTIHHLRVQQNMLAVVSAL